MSEDAGYILKSDRGFTLLELMFVLAVISILAIFGVPGYDAVKENYYLEGAAQKAASQLHYGQQMAMDKRQTVYIVFQEDQVGVYMAVDGMLELTAPALPYEGGVTFSIANNTWLAENEDNKIHDDLDDPSSPFLGWGVRYNFRGFALDAGTIRLEASSGQKICILITEGTGRVIIDQCAEDDGDQEQPPQYPLWSPQPYPESGTYVTYDGRVFYNRWYAAAGDIPGALGSPWQEVTDQWRNFNVYNTNDVVVYNSSQFKARGYSYNQQPGLLSSPWQELTDQWRDFNEYNSGEVVIYDGKQFQARNWSKNQQPGLISSPWQELTEEWRIFNIYDTGDEVLYNGHRYRAKYYSQNAQPDISDAWQLIS